MGNIFFSAFDPFTTYSAGGKVFLDHDGCQVEKIQEVITWLQQHEASNILLDEVNHNLNMIFMLGKAAYYYFSSSAKSAWNMTTEEDFNKAASIAFLASEKFLKFRFDSLDNESANLVKKQMSRSVNLIELWREHGNQMYLEDSNVADAFVLALAFETMKCVENCLNRLISAPLSLRYTWLTRRFDCPHYQQGIGNIEFLDSVERQTELLSEYTTIKATEAAKAKLENDPKQEEKQFIKECWLEWQSNKENYKSKAAFARDMLTKIEHIERTDTIERWCREWEKENRSC